MEFHIHNLLSCIPIIIKAIETAGEISGCDQHLILKKRIVLSKKYERDSMDPKIFQLNFGKQHLVSQHIYNRLDAVWKEDIWFLLETIREKISSGSLTKQEQRLMEVLLKKFDHNNAFDGKLFPSSILVGSKDYHSKRTKFPWQEEEEEEEEEKEEQKQQWEEKPEVEEKGGELLISAGSHLIR
ncbi:hypothetical protein NE237_023251 [Protea cynaroides]|uniref:DUF1221 domain-containing protein n=1 Tax=Protea cynaroides TaxID=273540 RepID=A0A9Q0HFY0_9MAGN|nr:hypothetical protein NE237_023251 [Protea cynaroides]